MSRKTQARARDYSNFQTFPGGRHVEPVSVVLLGDGVGSGEGPDDDVLDALGQLPRELDLVAHLGAGDLRVPREPQPVTCENSLLRKFCVATKKVLGFKLELLLFYDNGCFYSH